ncbi:MAG: hypothetical protein COB37_02525 [Kordiimonadales bacterium]|nr:MAG: hypothetical protein COB37_02525 [Kordiimonadales bacterium]
MIVFDLKCDADHHFEAWFQSSTAYEDQLAVGQVTCPYCDSAAITKAPMAPNIATKSNMRSESQPVETSSVLSGTGDEKLAALAKEANEVFARLKQHVEANCDYVGDNFADEARKIHYGESEERGIYGESTREETVELIEEGIDIMPLPGTPVRGNDA